MKLRNTKILFLIERNSKIRQDVFFYEEQLKNAFKTPFLIHNNISDQADPNIVRFQSTSLNSFSNLQVTQNKIILETNYDNNFESNFSLVANYLSGKIKILNPVVFKEKLNFIGILSLLDNEMENKDILPLIKSETDIKIIDNDLIEFKYQYAKKYENKYIANISIAPYTRIVAELININSKTAKAKIDSKGLQVKVDFNTNVPGVEKKELNNEMTENMLKDYFNLMSKNQLKNFLKGELL